MQITINNKTYSLHFGIEFIRQIDIIYEDGSNGGQGYGYGLSFLWQKLGRTASPVALADIIRAGTATEHTPPTVKEIEDYLANDETNMNELSESFYQALQKSPLPSKAVITTLRQMGLDKTPQPTEPEQGTDAAEHPPTPTKESLPTG